MPVFGTVAEAMKETGADVSVVFVPPAFTKDAVVEAIDAAIGLAVVITEGVPVHDSAGFWAHAVASGNPPGSSGRTARASSRRGSRTRASSRPDIAGAGADRAGVEVGHADLPDDVRAADIGFSTAIGIGGDPIIGTTHIDALEAFEADPETDAIVMIGEIGGDAEERAAEFIKANVTKPVVGYVAGFTAPEGKTMGHAGRDRVRLGGHRRGEAGGPRGRRSDLYRPHNRRFRQPRCVICTTIRSRIGRTSLS